MLNQARRAEFYYDDFDIEAAEAARATERRATNKLPKVIKFLADCIDDPTKFQAWLKETVRLRWDGCGC